MGNHQSLQSYILNEMDIKSTVNAAITSKNFSSGNSVSIQFVDISNGIYYDKKGNQIPCPNLNSSIPPTYNCGKSGFNISQNISQNLKIVDETKLNIVAELASKISQTAQNKMDDLLKQHVDSIIPSPNSTTQEVLNVVQNIVRDQLTINLTTNVLQEACASVRNEQQIKVGNCGIISGEGCNFNQNSLVDISISNISTIIANILADNEALATYFNEIKSVQEQTVTNPISTFFNNLANLGPLAIILISIVLIGVFIVGGIVIYKSSDALTDPSKAIPLIIFVIILVGLYFGLAWYFSWPPFSNNAVGHGVQVILTDPKDLPGVKKCELPGNSPCLPPVSPPPISPSRKERLEFENQDWFYAN